MKKAAFFVASEQLSVENLSVKITLARFWGGELFRCWPGICPTASRRYGWVRTPSKIQMYEKMLRCADNASREGRSTGRAPPHIESAYDRFNACSDTEQAGVIYCDFSTCSGSQEISIFQGRARLKACRHDKPYVASCRLHYEGGFFYRSCTLYPYSLLKLIPTAAQSSIPESER